eukprot:scaffold15810_cov117-Isochrysis_galbana.AAC.3
MMPPSKEKSRSGATPSSTREWQAAAERMPALQWTRMSPSAGSSRTMAAICRCGCCRSQNGSDTTSASRLVLTSSTKGAQPSNSIRRQASAGRTRAKRSAARAVAAASSAAAWPQKPGRGRGGIWIVPRGVCAGRERASGSDTLIQQFTVAQREAVRTRWAGCSASCECVLMGTEKAWAQPVAALEEPAREGVAWLGPAHTEHHLDRLGRLHRPDDSRQNTQHSALSARRHGPWRRWVGEEVAVVWPAAAVGQEKVEERDLALEFLHRPVHQRQAQHDAGVVDQVAGREVVRPVHHYIVPAQNLQSVARVQVRVVRDEAHRRVDLAHALRRRLHLGHAHRVGRVDNLPMQVGLVHHVVVHHPQRPDAGRSQVDKRGRAKAAGANAKHACALEPTLALDADIVQDQVPRVAPDLVVCQRWQHCRLVYGRRHGHRGAIEASAVAAARHPCGHARAGDPGRAPSRDEESRQHAHRGGQE